MVLYFVNGLLDPIIINLIIIFTLLYYYSTSTYDKWLKLNVAFMRPVPFSGNTFKMLTGLEHPADTTDRIYQKFYDKNICGFYQMRTPFLMIRDPELINAILVKDFWNFTDHGIDIDPKVKVMARSLFFLNGQKWKIMRRSLSPGFTSSKLRDINNQITECLIF